MSDAYEFAAQLEIGEEYEQELDSHFEQWFIVKPVSMEMQKLGIDRIFTRPGTGERYTVEYKTDLQAHETGNVFIETASVAVEDKVKVKGWGYTSTAQLLIYYVPGRQTYWILDMLKVKDDLPKWVKAHKTVKSQNNGYHGEGVLVPFGRLDKQSRGKGKVQNGGHPSAYSPKSRSADREEKILGSLGY